MAAGKEQGVRKSVLLSPPYYFQGLVLGKPHEVSIMSHKKDFLGLEEKFACS